MSDLHLERDFPVAPERLFDLVTTRAGLVQWFGPEGFTVPENALDFTRAGLWFAVMAGPEGRRLKVSGQVTSRWASPGPGTTPTTSAARKAM